MSPGSKALSFVIFPALALALLVLTPGQADAVPKTRGDCDLDYIDCLGHCDTNKDDCEKRPPENVSCEQQEQDCNNSCIVGHNSCLKDATAAPKVPKTKVQPKVKPGGAETPGTESPNVQPEGGIQRY